MLKSTRRAIIAAMIALLSIMAVAGTSTASAQTPDPTAEPTLSAVPSVKGEIEFVGAIQAINGKLITVSLQTVDTTRAEVKIQLRVGMMVKVHGWLESNNTITAREVELPSAKDSTSQAEFKGVVEQILGTTIVASGRTIDIGSARVESLLKVGQVIKVHIVPASISAPTMIATEVETSNMDFSKSSSDDDDDKSDDRGSDDKDDDKGGKGSDDKQGDHSGDGKGSDDSKDKDED